MKQKNMLSATPRFLVFVAAFWLLVFFVGATRAQAEDNSIQTEKDVTQGALRIVKKDGTVIECPLRHTNVTADVSGFIARVKVVQTFYNPLNEPIEAVYVFPLPNESAVDEMTMVIGERRIIGIIKRKVEAREIYETAIRSGQTAALLEQERPNIFVQSVGNIPPNKEIKIEIGYIDALKYDQGVYEFRFPMVVGPRYNPAGFTNGIGAVPQGQKGASGQKTEIEYLKPDQRNGHDISLSLKLDAGVPIRDIISIQHKTDISKIGATGANVKLSKIDSIPNKDFVLKYKVSGEKPESAVLTHALNSEGYFMLMIQPKDETETLKQRPPREIVFLIDTSGSMSGRPTEQCKDAMKEFLGLMRDKDTVQVITFAGSAYKLFEKPVTVTNVNIEKALNFTGAISGGGGTNMLEGIKAAINDPLDSERVRMVVMLTDGFIGNETQIIEEVGKSCGDRIKFWCIGVGSSVNQFLVDGIAAHGGGAGRNLSLNEPAEPLVSELMEKIQNAQLSNISIYYDDLFPYEVYPERIPNLYAGRPIVLFGRYEPGNVDQKYAITIDGSVEGVAVSWEMEVLFPAGQTDGESLSKVWARKKIESLMQQTYYAGSPEIEKEVTNIALEYGLMSQYTSFVTVDEKDADTINTQSNWRPRQIGIPVPMPDGVSYDDTIRYGFRDSLSTNGPKLIISPMAGIPVGYSADTKRQMPNKSGDAMEKSRMPSLMAPMEYAPRKQMRRNVAMDMPMACAEFSPDDNAKISLSKTSIKANIVDPLTTAIDNRNIVLNTMNSYGIIHTILQADSGLLTVRLQSLMENANKEYEAGNYLYARDLYAAAYMYATVTRNSQIRVSFTPELILEKLNGTNKSLMMLWKKTLPALESKLDIVLKNVDLEKALETISADSGIQIEIVPGSVEDACALLSRNNLRVSFLDLRNVSVLEALTWLLQPHALRWELSEKYGKMIVSCRSDRRSIGIKAWVYDVSHLAYPLMTEPSFKNKHNSQLHAELIKEQTEFIETVRADLRTETSDIIWFSAGKLLIIGTKTFHSNAADYFNKLESLNNLQDGSSDFMKKTAMRSAVYKPLKESDINSSEEMRMLETLRQKTWPVLIAAANDVSDHEAETELSIAINNPLFKELLVKQPLVSIRALWAYECRLSAISYAAQHTSLPKPLIDVIALSESKISNFEKSPWNLDSMKQAVYAVSLCRADTAFVKTAVQRMDIAASKNKICAQEWRFAKTLLEAFTSNFEDLALDVKKRLDPKTQYVMPCDDDEALFIALGCRIAGGDAWKAFREERKSFLLSQNISGGIVAFIHKLDGKTLPSFLK